MNQLQWWKLPNIFLGIFLWPNRSPWTISCILRLYQNHRATQTMPPKLDRYSRVSHWSDWTPCIHWSWKPDGRNISGAARFLWWNLYWTELVIAFFVHHTLVPRNLESIFADKKITQAFDIEWGQQKRTFNVWLGQGLSEWAKSLEYTIFLICWHC